jgi:hypothetical protein
MIWSFISKAQAQLTGRHCGVWAIGCFRSDASFAKDVLGLSGLGLRRP